MSLDKFFDPQSVAVVGASRHKGKVGYEVLSNLIRGGYTGRIFPVNPKAEVLAGLKCYPDLVSIGQIPDLAIVIVPAKDVPNIIRQCARIGTKWVIVVTGGFGETGRHGKDLEKEVVQLARQSGIRMVGPNSLGVIVPANKLNASFGGELPASGKTGYISQSGALLAAILDIARSTGIGFSKLVSIGNKADVDELEVLKALGSDADTEVIAGYLEDISDGNAFVKEAERISYRKPILLIKSGGTTAGATAASSHTGSLAGNDTAYECVFERAGIIRCRSVKVQVDYVQAFNQPLPKGTSVAIITNAGGAGIMAADAIERQGLSFAVPAKETTAKLAAHLPAAANLNNPVDILCDALADRYELAINAVLDDPGVDIVLVLLTPQAMTQADVTAEAVVRMAQQHKEKPVFACFLGAGQVEEGIKVLQEGKIPHYDSPEAAVNAIKVIADYAKWRSKPERVVKLFAVNRRKAETIVEKHVRQRTYEIGEVESKEILEAYGFAVPRAAVAATAEQAANIAQQVGFPVVVKIWSPEVIHKTDVGGVRLNLSTAEEVMDAFDLMTYRIAKNLPNINVLGVVVQEMITTGKEVILGMNRDPHCGPLMMFGMGGVLVEVLRDVCFYLAPLTAAEAKQMLMSTKTYQMLRGVRGDPGVDVEVIAEGLQRLSQLVTEFPQIQQIDINPYVVGPKGTTPVAVDARIVLGPVQTGKGL
ncbi:MAG TPA: acetate--CoA ligase family protein [Sedimentisphaerales bacterium]|nr:acetate--CoA ligase family protein [Sedimentisphaerales bacterium]